MVYSSATSAGASSEPLYYEDLTVGRIFKTAAVDVTEKEIIEFAQRYDPQPFHLDPMAATESLFGGLVASGWLTSALTMRLVAQGELQLSGGLIGLGIDSIKWPRAVRPGDRLTAASEVVAMRVSESKSNYGVVKVMTTTANQRGETVQQMMVNQLVLRRPGGVEGG